MIRPLALLTLMLFAHSSFAENLTILYTNDIESVYEPVASPWRDDMSAMGGMPYLSSLIKMQRTQHENTLLVDAGDMFTGSLSKATEGRLVFDLYSEMGYDVGNLGNHEFEYGWRILRDAMPRARFPILNANIFYENTDIPFAREYAIVKSGRYRVGVIGLMGIDAFHNTMMRSHRNGLEIRSPIDIAQSLADRLRPEVDFLIVLTHQNRTAPMQTNKESDPTVLRGFDEDYALAGKVHGIDLIVGGHSDHGLHAPVVHPETGTTIVMTFGQGMHLGRVTFDMSAEDGPRLQNGELIPVNADHLPPDPSITQLINNARAQHPALTRVVATLKRPALRLYNQESSLGSLLADALKQQAGVEVAMVPAGAIRADLQSGAITVEALLNVFPFTDQVTVVQLQGSALLKLLEKGVSLDYGLSQFSGVALSYDSSQPVGQRVIDVSINGETLDLDRTYRFATGSFTATGGEGYDMFEDQGLEIKNTLVSDAFITVFEQWQTLSLPEKGRLQDIAL